MDFRDERLDKESEVVTKEVEDALALSESLTTPTKKEKKRKTNVGDRRRATHGSWNREPIDGYTMDHSEVARRVIGLKYAGFALREAFEDAGEKYNLRPHSVENLYYKKKRLFDLAEVEHVGNALREENFNRAVCKTMLSQAGPMAVETLVEVLENEKSTPNLKSKTAIAILKMLDIDGSASGQRSGEAATTEYLKLVKEVVENRNKEQESSIIEAEDVEILEEEDDCETRADSCM